MADRYTDAMVLLKKAEAWMRQVAQLAGNNQAADYAVKLQQGIADLENPPMSEPVVGHGVTPAPVNVPPVQPKK